MPKPTITKRATKAAALTYAELDTNFQNIVDATVTVTADTGTKTLEQIDSLAIAGGVGLTTSIAGSTLTVDLDNTAVTPGAYNNVNIIVDAQGRITAAASGIAGGNTFSTIAVAGQSNVVADSLSDTLTLIAGSNITLTTNATNDSITIASTAGAVDIVNDLTPQLGGNLDTNGKSITNALGRVLVNDELNVTTGSAGTGINIGAFSGGAWRIESNAALIIGAEISTFGGPVTGANINMGEDSFGNGYVIIGTDVGPNDRITMRDVVRLNTMTTTERNSITTPQNGDLFYNSTTHKFQGYANGVWVDLH